ncbi:MAG: hypothetical protein HeimC2_23880 [Candidatus Heimdallarchaeota archaeon LC_2]|nr:MAG: hypothetical protein HeimC2_23880 [Candidatus Heimdallarchaeota archaeon LC_2]
MCILKVKTSTHRKFQSLFDKLRDPDAAKLLDEYGITEDTIANQRYNEIINGLGDDLSVSIFRKLWRKSEVIELFSSWVSIFNVEKQKITFTKFKKKFQGAYKPANHFFLDLSPNKSLKIYQFVSLAGSHKGMIEKAASDINQRDSMYWLPEDGLLLLRIHTDKSGNNFKSQIEKNIPGKIEPFRIKSMIISKFYRETKIIKQLNVSAIFEITGFAGFSELSFKGDHVKQGLYGLHKRQDIRVNLDQIGPNIQAASENLHLKIGPQVMIKNFEGFSELKTLVSES